jgi:hypothetical protein
MDLTISESSSIALKGASWGLFLTCDLISAVSLMMGSMCEECIVDPLRYWEQGHCSVTNNHMICDRRVSYDVMYLDGPSVHPLSFYTHGDIFLHYSRARCAPSDINQIIWTNFFYAIPTFPEPSFKVLYSLRT